jgi:F-type H+-transporting ATPase subunit alpha
MKQVAGRLRLDLAQYRELAAFAQFGSELDKTTQAQLVRGERMVELLKQDQYQPMALSDQVIGLFAGVQGYLDDIAVTEVRKFEQELLAFIEAKYPDIRHEIQTKKVLEPAIQKGLEDAIRKLKEDRKGL